MTEYPFETFLHAHFFLVAAILICATALGVVWLFGGEPS